MSRRVTKSALRAAGLFGVLSLTLYAGCEVAIRRELAAAHGEKDLGIGFLALSFAIPALVFAAIATVYFIIALAAIIEERRKRDS